VSRWLLLDLLIYCFLGIGHSKVIFQVSTNSTRIILNVVDFVLVVVKNLVHVVVAGLIAHWYLETGESSLVSGLTLKCLTSSFGSVCACSLLVPFAHFARAITYPFDNLPKIHAVRKKTKFGSLLKDF
jgi:hypothetical protein